MDPSLRLRSLAALAALFLPAGSAHAASILWLDSENATSNSGAGRAPDASWITLLAGHTVTTFDSVTYKWDLSTQASKDYVAGFDLVIMTRTNNAFGTLRAFGTAWQAVSTPMIETNPYMLGGEFSSSTWSWLSSGGGSAGAASGANITTNISNASDPIWNGVTLLNGNTQAPNLLTSTGNFFDRNGNTLKPGITALATRPSDADQILLAYAQPGALSATSGPRYFMSWGNDVLPEQFNADGEKVFLNAVTQLVPEPSAALLGGLGALLLLRRRR